MLSRDLLIFSALLKNTQDVESIKNSLTPMDSPILDFKAGISFMLFLALIGISTVPFDGEIEAW